MDFPFPSAVLKKRIHPKTKTGEPLINKLGRDCFLLHLASKGEYSDDLKDKIDNLYKTNEKLDYNFHKQKNV
jgi:hypothetical protein